MGHSGLRAMIRARGQTGVMDQCMAMGNSAWRPEIMIRDQPVVQGQTQYRVRDRSEEERPPRRNYIPLAYLPFTDTHPGPIIP